MRFILTAIFLLINANLWALQLSLSQQQKIDALLAVYKSESAPGLAVGVVANGEIVYEEYRALSDLANKVPFSSVTRSNIASNAKQFVAVMTLDLANKGLLKLTDDIRLYLPDLYKNYDGEILIKQLINHSSGIRDIYGLMGLQGNVWWRSEGLDNEDILAIIGKQEELNFPPGSNYLYSNTNYILLTAIISKVTNTDFIRYSNDFFQNLGMKETSFVSDYMLTIPNKARPYADWGSWKEYPSIVNVHGDGNLFTTLSDQLKWEILLQQSESSYLHINTLSQSQRLLNNTTVTNYGFGVEHNTFKGLPTTSHDGETGAYEANFLRFPEEQLAIVVMTNNGQIYARGLSQKIAEIVLDSTKFEEIDYPTKPNSLGAKIPQEDLLGYYEHEDGSIIRFVDIDGKLHWRIGQNRPFAFELAEGNLYTMSESTRLKVAFQKNGADEVESLTVYYPGSAPRLHIKYPSLSENTALFEAMNGTYHNQELGVSLTIEYMGKYQFQLSSSTQDRTTKVEMIKQDELNWNGYQLVPISNEKGVVTHILLNEGRIKNIRFKRN